MEGADPVRHSCFCLRARLECQESIPMSVIEWLLDSDPSIRWQVMRDLLGEPEASVARERSRVALEGWGARLLDLQGADGHWGGAAFVPRAWISTMDTLQLLRDLGVDPTSDRTRRAIAQVRDRCTWGAEFDDAPFFEGEVEPCINGRVLAIGVYFGEARRSSRRPAAPGAVERRRLELRRPAQPAIVVPHDDLRARRTAGVREGEGSESRRHRRPPPRTGVSARAPPVPLAIDRTDRSKRTARPEARPRGPRCSFPTRWHYDILWGLDYLRGRASRPTSAWPRRSIWCGRSATNTGDGRSKTRIRVQRISRWKAAPASRAAGTPSGRSACCAGPRVDPERNGVASEERRTATRTGAGNHRAARVSRPRRASYCSSMRSQARPRAARPSIRSRQRPHAVLTSSLASNRLRSVASRDAVNCAGRNRFAHAEPAEPQSVVGLIEPHRHDDLRHARRQRLRARADPAMMDDG